MRAVCLLALVAAGCIGEVGGSGGGSGVTGASGVAEGQPTGAAPRPADVPSSPAPPRGGPDPVAAGGACGSVDPGPAFLRKLTADEYDATVAALLGDESRPGDKFPSEGRALGFDNNAENTSVSLLAAEQYMQAAATLAARAVAPGRLEKLLPCAAMDDACGRQFIEQWGKRAWRRPLEIAEKAELGKVFVFGRESSFQRGIELVIRVMLQSPQFLYRVEVGQPVASGQRVARPTHFEMATRLSYLLWGSMPDEALFAAAEAGRLGTAADVAAQARRMIADPRARRITKRLHEQWLELELYDSLEKERSLFPTFDPALGPLLRQETERLIEHVVWEVDGRMETLFQAPFTFLNAKLAAFYKVKGPAGEAFEKVGLDPGQRMGLLTNAGWLAAHSYHNQTSPIHRGKSVRMGLLCQEMPPPPDDVMVEPPKLDPSLTTRERFARHSTDPLCAGCHRLIDPIGLGFERYDAVGLHRTTEAGRAIDASGEVTGSSIGKFDGAIDLGRKLAASPELRACVLLQWFRFGFGRGEIGGDACALKSLETALAQARGDVRQLLVALTQTDAFLYRRAGGAP